MDSKETRTLEVGKHVIYIDPVQKRRDAVVTAVFDKMMGDMPGCNVVFVHDDEERHDTYGRQIDRETSVVHKSVQPAPGNCWCWPDE